MRLQLWELTRICFFSWQVIANAIICSIGVWQLSATSGLAIDRYLIFLGAFCLAFLFGIIFIELLVENPVTSRLWFELAWVCVLLMMQLAGAIALCVKHGTLCNVDAQACQSSQVLLAFIWICFMTLVSYAILLTFPAYQCQRSDPRIWDYPVSSFKWSNRKNHLLDPPTSPVLPTKTSFNQDNFVVAAPVARRAQNLRNYAHRFGLGSDYEIEHYQPPNNQGIGVKQVPADGACIPPVPPIPTAAATTSQDTNFRLSNHPPDVTSYPGPSTHHVQMRSPPFSQHPPEQVHGPPLGPVRREPSPNEVAGSVPHPYATTMHAPSKALSKQKQPERMLVDRQESEEIYRPPEPDTHKPSSSSRVKPSGPRRQSAGSGTGPSSSRPPPLTLESISSYRDPHR